jgi:arylformamidase
LNRFFFITFLFFFAITPQNLMARDNSDSKWSMTLTETDISYGLHARNTLDIYAPRGLKALKPIHVFIHGGGWHRGDKKRYEDMGHFYADRGIVFVAINYRLSPEVKHPKLAEDSAKAVKWVYDNISKYGGDHDKIVLSGHSAGAQLAALIATDPRYLSAHNLQPNFLRAVIPNDTASFDFTDPIKKGRWFVQPLIDETFGTDNAGLVEASPITHARTNKALPRFVLFVTNERPDAVVQTQNFHNAIIASGGKSDVHIIDGNSHREMAKGMFDANSAISKEILKVLWD